MSVERFPIEGAHLLMFARSLGDMDATYSDAAFAEGGFAGVAAPPTFVQASAQFEPDFPLRPQPGQRWFGSGQADSGEQDESSLSESSGDAGVLHAEQRFDFARPVRVGDVLTARQREGRTWEKSGRRGGRMVFSELITEFFDTEGEPVVIVTSVAVRPETIPSEAGESK